VTKPSGWHRKSNDTPAERARTAQYNSAEHKQQVAAVKALVASGRAFCWRCGRHLPPGSKAHAGHDDHDRSRYRGAECPPCNLSAAARKGARIVNRRRHARRVRRIQGVTQVRL
jgi:DNA-directed RNA polymerase subunit RPC12/RpoP